MQRIAPIFGAAIWLVAIVWLARPATAASGCVATVHPLATDAGIAALARGGNAIDAAIAAAFTLGVVDNHNSGIGGGCFILVRLADGKLVAIDGRETAPAKATRDMFLRDGKPQPELSQTGPLASGVPGALAAYEEAVRNFGRLPLRELVIPAAEIAERGIVVDRSCAARLKEAAKTLARFPGSRAVLLRRDGSAYEEGDLLKQPDLARFGKHTTHIAAVDGEGNWVALTTTINGSFGSKVIVPGTGVLLNNQMDDFAIAPGVPNSAGLLGADANAVAPGKRPLSSMSPTIVLKDERPILTLGAAGGPRIITQVVMALVYHCDLGLDLPKAIQSPRIHHQWQPDRLSVESSLAPELVAALEKYGHKVPKTKSTGVTQAIGLSPDEKTWIGVHDPRVSGKAAVR